MSNFGWFFQVDLFKKLKLFCLNSADWVGLHSLVDPASSHLNKYFQLSALCIFIDLVFSSLPCFWLSLEAIPIVLFSGQVSCIIGNMMEVCSYHG